MKHRPVACVALLACLLCSGVAGAQGRACARSRFGADARRIDFDRDASGEPLADRAPLERAYAAWGVTFGADDLATATDGLLVSGLNRALPGADGVLDVVFRDGVRAVGAYGFDVVLEAFDERGALLFRTRHTDGTPGLLGGARELGWVGVSSARAIRRVRFSRAFPAQSAYGFNIDDLWFVPVTPAAGAPAPRA